MLSYVILIIVAHQRREAAFEFPGSALKYVFRAVFIGRHLVTCPDLEGAVALAPPLNLSPSCYLELRVFHLEQRAAYRVEVLESFINNADRTSFLRLLP